MPGSVRLWLVSTAIAMSSSGSQRTAERKPEQAAGVAEGRWPSISTAWTPEAVRDARLVRLGPADVVEHRRDATSGSSTLAARTGPAPSGRGRSSVDGEAAGAAGGGDDRGERHDRRAVGQVDGRAAFGRRREPVAVGDVGAGVPRRLVPGVVEAERLEEARPDCSASGAPPTARRACPRTR